MKRVMSVIFLIVLLLVSCEYDIPMQQTVEDIAKIELINEEEDGVVCTLTEAEAVQFMEDLMELGCHKNLQPLGSVGYLQVHIHYENGDSDIIGCRANAYIRGGKMTTHGWYYFKEEELLVLFDSYCDPKAGPDSPS